MSQGDQTYEASKVEFRAMRDDWSMFEVLVYENEDDIGPVTTFSPTMFQRVADEIEKRRKSDIEEVYKNPRGQIEVKLTRDGMQGSVTLDPA